MGNGVRLGDIWAGYREEAARPGQGRHEDPGIPSQPQGILEPTQATWTPSQVETGASESPSLSWEVPLCPPGHVYISPQSLASDHHTLRCVHPLWRRLHPRSHGHVTTGPSGARYPPVLPTGAAPSDTASHVHLPAGHCHQAQNSSSQRVCVQLVAGQHTHTGTARSPSHNTAEPSMSSDRQGLVCLGPFCGPSYLMSCLAYFCLLKSKDTVWRWAWSAGVAAGCRSFLGSALFLASSGGHKGPPL